MNRKFDKENNNLFNFTFYQIVFLLVCFSLCFSNLNVEGRIGIGDFEQDWGYITVRPYAHMFWWLFYTRAPVTHFSERPLIIWLQGGPGMPSSGYGNFIEIGPLDLDMKKRNHTWINNFNVLFIDNPVGVGFSYIDDNATNLVTNNEEIGKDLVIMFEGFLKIYKQFETVPLYIFGESYGGKMAVEFAHQLNNKIKLGQIRANFRGIGLGDSYISPIDYIMNYAPFALNLGLIDKHGYHAINKLAKQIQKAINEERYFDAALIESKITKEILDATKGIDIYNIMLKSNMTSLPQFLTYQDSCTFFMNTKIKEALDIPENVEWNFINDDIYASLYHDLPKSVTATIENLLNNTDIKVIVYNGVFDYIVNTPGTVKWLDNLNWRGKSKWQKERQNIIEINMINEGYVKEVDNLVFYTVLRAGHSVPIDNIIAMEEILLRELLNSTTSN